MKQFGFGNGVLASEIPLKGKELLKPRIIVQAKPLRRGRAARQAKQPLVMAAQPKTGLTQPRITTQPKFDELPAT